MISLMIPGIEVGVLLKGEQFLVLKGKQFLAGAQLSNLNITLIRVGNVKSHF